MSNNKVEASFHASGDLHTNDIADWVADQFEVATQQGGNDIEGIHVLGVINHGDELAVSLVNGQSFTLLISERHF